jgi:hypothetical protein
MNFLNVAQKSDMNSVEESDQFTAPTPSQFQLLSGTVSTKQNQVQFVNADNPDQFSQTEQTPVNFYKSGVSF